MTIQSNVLDPAPVKVGGYWFNSTGTNPASELGYGTWTQTSQGQFLVGQKATDVDFDVAEEAGGAKVHTHAGHAAHVVTQPASHAATATSAADVGATKIGTTVSTATLKAHMHNTPVLAHSGAAVDAHSAHDLPSHLPPYMVVYIWKRTA